MSGDTSKCSHLADMLFKMIKKLKLIFLSIKIEIDCDILLRQHVFYNKYFVLYQ